MQIRALFSRPTRNALRVNLILSLFALTCGGALLVPTTNVRAQEPTATPAPQTQGQQQRLVESVDIVGNRRNRKEDLLYYVQTRPGDPYNKEQVQRDYQALMNLGLFDKLSSRVLEQNGAKGGVNVIFEVVELPIIRDLTFEGLKDISDADVLKAFREQRIGVSKEATYDPVKVNNSIRVIKELLAARGYPNATVNVTKDDVSRTSIALKYNVDQGVRVRVAEIDFTGAQHFSNKQLRGSMKYVKETGLFTRFRSQDILDPEKLEADLKGNVTNFMRSKGYLQARTGDPAVESLGMHKTGLSPLPIVSSTDETLKIIVPVVEGRLYRVGDIKIEGNSVISEQVIRAVIGLNKGDVANGERLGKGLYEDLAKVYGNAGFIQYTYDLEPTFRDDPNNPNEGIADLKITIEEGKQFTLRRLEFIGNTFTRDNVLRREVLLNEGDVYNQGLLEFSVTRLNQLGYFDPIDKDKDVEKKQNEEQGEVDVNIKVVERGRQQISFNGGVSGIGGSFFGLQYSTNNLLGRGESLSFDASVGNRQRSFVFSFTEPYVKNRPVTVGFSVFTQSLQFFGEGTLLSQNTSAINGALSSSGLISTTDFLTTSSENLFTQVSTGASVFASAPLSEFYKKRRFTQFSRIGLSYSISRTSIKDPEVNAQGNASTFIPVIYRQPNIITSRITPTFVYDSRDYRGGTNIDATSGKQISLGVALAGLGGDVRTYEPTLSYIQFIPVRHKRTRPEVFGFRLLAGYVGSFAITDKVREAQATSLSYINGVPVFERFFLGDEFTVRGYNVRSITPFAPVDNYIASRNVIVAQNATGTPVAAPNIPTTLAQQIAALGTFTGVTGANVFQLSRSFTATGGDTQLLGNFEYRIPLFGPVQAAAFIDVGSTYNLRKLNDQIYSSQFLADQPFIGNCCYSIRNSLLAGSLNAFTAANNPQIAITPGGALLLRDGRLASQEEYVNALGGATNPITGLPVGFDPIFLRGDVQTNTAVRLSQSIFSDLLGNVRSSAGMELRVQLPVVNVPLRLIYAYNPNARTGVIGDISGAPFTLQEKRNVFRFSIGRTF